MENTEDVCLRRSLVGFGRAGEIVTVSSDDARKLIDNDHADAVEYIDDDEPATVLEDAQGVAGDEDVPSMRWTRPKIDSWAAEHNLGDTSTAPTKAAALDMIEQAQQTAHVAADGE